VAVELLLAAGPLLLPVGPLLPVDPTLLAVDPALPDAELVPVEALPLGEVLLAFCAGDEPADADGVAATEGLGLGEAVDVGVAFWLGVEVELVQLVAVGFGVLLLPLGLAVAVALFVAVAVAVAVALAVGGGLLVALGLTGLLALLVGPPLPVDGLVGELGGGVDGLAGELGGGVDGLAEFCVVLDEGDDDGAHGGSTVGAFRPAGVVAAAPVTPVPLPRVLPPLPEPAEPPAPEFWWPPRTCDTEELSAWRSGLTEASNTPTAKTAQPIAMAGLSSASRQSQAWRDAGRACPGPELCPPPGPAPGRGRKRRIMSARKPEIAGQAAAQACLLAKAGPDWTRARIRSRPSACGSI
jgi:hypothetical protein